MLNYRNVEEVRAYQLDDSERISTRDGVRDAAAGEWVVYGAQGVSLMSDEAFRARFSEYGNAEQESPVQEDGGEAYDPADHTVSEVIAYFRTADQDEIDRVKGLESIGSNRATILNY